MQPLLIACEVPGDEKLKVDIDNLITLIRDLQEEAKGATSAMQIDLANDLTADGKPAVDAPLILPSRLMSRNNAWERDVNDAIALGQARKNRSSMAKRIRVTEAGSIECNGLYIYDGIYNSKPQFKGQRGFNIYWDNIFEAWVLCKNMVHEYYTCRGAVAKQSKMPPLEGWEKERGREPMPKFEPLYKKKDKRRLEQESKKKKRRGGGLELDEDNPNLVGTDAGESQLTIAAMMSGPSSRPPSLETATGGAPPPLESVSAKPKHEGGNDAATAISLDDDDDEPPATAPTPAAPADPELSETAPPSQALDVEMPTLDPAPNTQFTANAPKGDPATPAQLSELEALRAELSRRKAADVEMTSPPKSTDPDSAGMDVTDENGGDPPPQTSAGKKNILDMAGGATEDAAIDLTDLADDVTFASESCF